MVGGLEEAEISHVEEVEEGVGSGRLEFRFTNDPADCVDEVELCVGLFAF